MAAAHGRTERTLRNWTRRDPSCPRRRGRAEYTPEQRDEARRAVREQLERVGWSAGEPTLVRELGRSVPRRLLREVLKTEKAEHERRLRAHSEAARVSVEVLARDAVWALDATHLGRDPFAVAIEGEVVREACSAKTVWVQVGPSSTGEDIVVLLEWLRRLNGGLPLVLMTDNGSAYRSRCVRAYLRRQRVVHVFSVPHTPEHNPFAERANGELKAETGLGKGVVLAGAGEARARIAPALERLNTQRPRPSRGWLTAQEAYRAAPPWQLLVDRETIWRAARCAEARAVVGCWNRRRLRCARREAQLAVIEWFGLIRRTRGDARRRASIVES